VTDALIHFEKPRRAGGTVHATYERERAHAKWVLSEKHEDRSAATNHQ
jgi:hypothetical protein